MASVGTQRNGLPVEVLKFDTIGVHDYADTSTWPATNDSSWTLDPTDESSEYHDKVVKITEMQLDLAEDIVMHSAGNLVVEFYMTGNPNPVKTIYYKTMADWISKAAEKHRFPNEHNVGNYFQYNGREQEAREIYDRLMAGSGWAGFGYIAAEAELAAMH